MKKISFALLLVLITSGVSFAQLDSTSLSLDLLEFNGVDDFGDSISGKYIEATVWVNDIDFFGELVITAFDEDANFPVNKLKYTKSEAISDSLVTGNLITFPIYNIEDGRDYRLELFVRNYQGNNLPMQIENISAD